jgi:hypothetical protein
MAHIKKLPKHVVKLLNDKGAIIKLDVGCREPKEEGFIGIDYRNVAGVDIVHDVESQPWPLPAECASLVMVRHLVEHIDPANRGFIKFMDECWRVLKYGGQLLISTPYAGSSEFWADPTNINGCTPKTWEFFDPEITGGVSYEKYKPKPWKILNCCFQVNGYMEALLEKRRIDKTPKKK